jgi:hypothetical protein
MRKTLISALIVLAAFAAPAVAATDVCGDLDGSGSLVASDALLLLKRAVGQNVTVQCPDCPNPPTCAELGESCTVTEDCCPVDTPPPIVGNRGAAVGSPAPCCGGTCQVFGVCKGDDLPCSCGAECCSGSCGQQVVGECD